MHGRGIARVAPHARNGSSSHVGVVAIVATTFAVVGRRMLTAPTSVARFSLALLAVARAHGARRDPIGVGAGWEVFRLRGAR